MERKTTGYGKTELGSDLREKNWIESDLEKKADYGGGGGSKVRYYVSFLNFKLQFSVSDRQI